MSNWQVWKLEGRLNIEQNGKPDWTRNHFLNWKHPELIYKFRDSIYKIDAFETRKLKLRSRKQQSVAQVLILSGVTV
jgi:hypothetical protein